MSPTCGNVSSGFSHRERFLIFAGSRDKDLAGMLALLGLPPFGLFVSEFLLIQAAVVDHSLWLAAVVLLFLLTAFISLLSHLNRMLYGPPPEGVRAGEPRGWPILALLVPVAILVVLGMALPAPMSALLQQSVGTLAP